MQEGMPKYILEEVLQHYLDLEDYLACAGIKKGLDWYDTNSFVRNLYIIDEIIDKNE